MESKRWFYVGLAILTLLVVAALLAPLLAPHDPTRQNLDNDLRSYSMENPLGTDKLGRDILSRVLYGGRISLLVGATTVVISLAIGLAIGSLSGYFGGWTDQLLMRAGRYSYGVSRDSPRHRLHGCTRSRSRSRHSGALFDRLDRLRTIGPRRDSCAQGAGVCPGGPGHSAASLAGLLRGTCSPIFFLLCLSKPPLDWRQRLSPKAA